jgi:hypothetical protein
VLDVELQLEQFVDEFVEWGLNLEVFDVWPERALERVRVEHNSCPDLYPESVVHFLAIHVEVDLSRARRERAGKRRDDPLACPVEGQDDWELDYRQLWPSIRATPAHGCGTAAPIVSVGTCGTKDAGD